MADVPPLVNDHTPPVYGVAEELPKCQVSPILKMKPSPARLPDATVAHVEVQLGIPGACAHGAPSVVPALESEPLAAMK